MIIIAKIGLVLLYAFAIFSMSAVALFLMVFGLLHIKTPCSRGYNKMLERA